MLHTNCIQSYQSSALLALCEGSLLCIHQSLVDSPDRRANNMEDIDIIMCAKFITCNGISHTLNKTTWLHETMENHIFNYSIYLNNSYQLCCTRYQTALWFKVSTPDGLVALRGNLLKLIQEFGKIAIEFQWQFAIEIEFKFCQTSKYKWPHGEGLLWPPLLTLFFSETRAWISNYISLCYNWFMP